MIDYLEIGATPAAEPCAQVGDPNYATLGRTECHRFRKLLRKLFGNEPEGAMLVIRPYNHEFGTYYEVAVKFDTDIPEAIEYAYMIEGNVPEYWGSTIKFIK